MSKRQLPLCVLEVTDRYCGWSTVLLIHSPLRCRVLMVVKKSWVFSFSLVFSFLSVSFIKQGNGLTVFNSNKLLYLFPFYIQQWIKNRFFMSLYFLKCAEWQLSEFLVLFLRAKQFSLWATLGLSLSLYVHAYTSKAYWFNCDVDYRIYNATVLTNQNNLEILCINSNRGYKPVWRGHRKVLG